MTDQPTAGVALKPLVDRLHEEIAEASRTTEATPLERFVAEALTSDDAKAKGLVDRVWVVSLPDARKAIAAITEWNTRAAAPVAPAGRADVERAVAAVPGVRDAVARGLISMNDLSDAIMRVVGVTAAPAGSDGPQEGRWYAAEDIDSMVRDLDKALNGDGAARQAKLCDIYPQIIALAARAQPPAAEAVLLKALADIQFMRKDEPGQTDRHYAERAAEIARQAIAARPAGPSD